MSSRAFAAFGLPIMVKNSTRVVFDHVIDSKLVPRRVSAERQRGICFSLQPQKQINRRFATRNDTMVGALLLLLVAALGRAVPLCLCGGFGEFDECSVK